MAKKTPVTKKSTARTELLISYENKDLLKKAADKKSMSASSYVDLLLTEHFNQSVLTQEAIYRQLTITQKSTNEVKKLLEVLFEVQTIYLESYYSRVADVPEESRKAAGAKSVKIVEAILGKAVKNISSGLSYKIGPTGISDQSVDDVMSAATEFLDKN